MSGTIRILHVLHAFSAGGLENGIVNIINQSPDHLVHELCLLSTSGEFVQRLRRPVVVHEMNKNVGNDVRMIFRLRELFKRRQIDIVHTRNWAGFDGVMAACLTHQPGLVHGEHGRDISDPNGLIYRRNLARRLLRFRAKKYVAVSKDLYHWLNRTVRIPESKLTLIPNGVDTDRYRPGRDPELRKELGIGDDEFVVGSIGRLDPIKNHVGLINAVRILNRGARQARLVIVGEGPTRPKIDAAFMESSLKPKPLLLGYRSDVERLYRIFDVFVLNSFAEGMSNTLLEAMAAGLPIVCTGVGGNVELVADGQTGTIVKPNDDLALAEALRQYGETSNHEHGHGSNARDFIVNNFSLKNMIDRYVALYESVA